MKQLIGAREAGIDWVEVSAIASKHKLTEIKTGYYLRILEKYGFVIQHSIDGGWRVTNKGIDYLVEHQHI
jgi:RIO-like serine/threonine protein kinase